MSSNESATPSDPCPRPDAAPRRDWITLAHPLELDAEPGFDSWPPTVSLDVILTLSERILRDRAAAGLPLRDHDPVPFEFVL